MSITCHHAIISYPSENITRQVRYLGLLENVKVRRAGYAHRSLYDR